ncbi:Conjugation protein [Profundibacterium mesophilum KAUST100406-0324]|uniref:Conjugation protein n=2 Tax=Profundibacterium TaxID=1258570 RepID=A0A921NQD6_9RHOB|nr:Conjugation protein [Profundibacterium mesophilum KAUST100406-0324]
MTDQRTGLIYNYRSVPGLLGEGLVHWDGSAEELWNAAEASESRINARVARELRPALPAELPLDDQLRLVRGFCLFLKDRYGVAAQWVVHAPTFLDEGVGKHLWKGRNSDEGRKNYLDALNDPDRTNLNFHAHIRWTVREVDRDTGVFGKKTRTLDDKATGAKEVKAIRAEWERRTNAALERAGSHARIDLRSYKDMAAAGDAPEDLQAQEHAGPRRTAKLRKAMDLFDEPLVAGRNAMVREENEMRWETWFELRRLARKKARLEGESERVAQENEQRRRAQAEVDKKKLREATTADERALALAQAGAVDAPVAGDAMDAALAWAQNSDASPEGSGDAFERPVDLEAPRDPDAPPPPGEPLRVKRYAPERVRVRND